MRRYACLYTCKKLNSCTYGGNSTCVHGQRRCSTSAATSTWVGFSPCVRSQSTELLTNVFVFFRGWVAKRYIQLPGTSCEGWRYVATPQLDLFNKSIFGVPSTLVSEKIGSERKITLGALRKHSAANQKKQTFQSLQSTRGSIYFDSPPLLTSTPFRTPPPAVPCHIAPQFVQCVNNNRVIQQLQDLGHTSVLFPYGDS